MPTVWVTWVPDNVNWSVAIVSVGTTVSGDNRSWLIMSSLGALKMMSPVDTSVLPCAKASSLQGQTMGIIDSIIQTNSAIYNSCKFRNDSPVATMFIVTNTHHSHSTQPNLINIRYECLLAEIPFKLPSLCSAKNCFMIWVIPSIGLLVSCHSFAYNRVEGRIQPFMCAWRSILGMLFHRSSFSPESLRVMLTECTIANSPHLPEIAKFGCWFSSKRRINTNVRNFEL
jgi:hypothetical protein